MYQNYLVLGLLQQEHDIVSYVKTPEIIKLIKMSVGITTCLHPTV